MKKQWLYVLAGGMGALVLVFGAGFVMFRTAQAVSDPMLQARTGLAHGKPGDPDQAGAMQGYQQALAEVLGMSLEDLQQAYQAAREQAIDLAVEQGLIPPDRAEVKGSGERRGFRVPGMPFMGGVEFQGFLADALGISESELADAQALALQTVLDQAVEDGLIDPEEAELIQAREAIREYLVEAIGAAFEEAVSNAVEEGVISQDLADRLLAEGWGFPGGSGFPPGGGRPGW